MGRCIYRCVMMLASCVLIVTSIEERLLIGDTALQSEIQELRSKVTSLEKKVSFLETKSNSSSVAFMNQLSTTLENPTKGHIVIFDDVITDVGHAYSSSTGVFRAPVDGTYVFILIATEKPIPGDHHLHLLIKKNGNAIGYLFLDSNHDYFLKRTEISTVSLVKDDEVYVQVDAAVGIHNLIGNNLHSHFSGFLIHQ